MFKPIFPAAVLAIAIATAVMFAPAAAVAQTNGTGRAQVNAELAQLERAGYSPADDQTHYPLNIQLAEQRVASENAAGAAYGASTNGTSAASAAGSAQPAALDSSRP